jgi:hypothetical protein
MAKITLAFGMWILLLLFSAAYGQIDETKVTGPISVKLGVVENEEIQPTTTSGIYFTILNPVFEFENQTTQNPKNYQVSEDSDLILWPDSIMVTGSLNVEKNTGDIKESAIYDIGIVVSIDKKSENTATGETTYSFDSGIAKLGDDYWWQDSGHEPRGQLVLNAENKGTFTLEAD